MKFVKSIFYLLLFVTTTTVAQQQLGYNLKVGDSFSLTQKSVQTIVQQFETEGMTMDIELINDVQAEFLMTVVETHQNSYIIDFEFTNFAYQMRSDTMGTVIDVDTSAELDESDMTQAIFRGLLGVTMTMEMLKTGRIIDITGGDALIDNMIKNSGITDETQIQAMRDGMEKEYGGQKIAAGFEQFTYIYPETSKKTGESWENSIDGELKAEQVWTLAAFDRNVLSIVGVSEGEMESDSGTTRIKVKGTQNTQIEADPAHGFIKTYHSESVTEGESFVDSYGDSAIPTKITTITDYTIN